VGAPMTRLAMLVLAMILAAGCAPAARAPASAPSLATAPQAAAQQPAGGGGASFQQLVARARASDGRLRSGLASYTPAYIRAIETRFEQRVGIRPRLENAPG